MDGQEPGGRALHPRADDIAGSPPCLDGPTPRLGPEPVPDPRAPTRLIARLVTEMTMARAARWHPLTSPDPLADMTFQTVLSANIAHLPYRRPQSGMATGPDGSAWHGFSSLADHGRPVTVMGVSCSNGLSYPSVRRRALELIGSGHLVRHGSRLSVPARLVQGGDFAAVMMADAAALSQFVARLAAADHPLARRIPPLSAARIPDDVAARALLAFSLRVLETLTTLYGDVTDGRLIAAAVAANIRHITADPVAARRYAAEADPPPDSERRPISLRELARQAGRPFETVRRRSAVLIETGVMEMRGDGVVVPVRVLMGEAQRANNRRVAQHVDQLLRLLESLAESG